MSMTSKQGLERLYSSGTPLIRTPMGQKKNGRINGLAVFTRVFFTRKCMVVFARRPQKVAVITRWP